MIEWLKKLFHIHEWVIVYEYKLNDAKYKYPVGDAFLLRCKVCGKLKYKKFF